MIFLFHRSFGSKARERLEDYQAEAASLEEAFAAISTTQPQAKVERLKDTLYLTWRDNGQECFDIFWFNRIEPKIVPVD